MKKGAKVIVLGKESDGYGEFHEWGTRGFACIRYYYSPVGFEEISVTIDSLSHSILPEETRCYGVFDGATKYGRILAHLDGNTELRTYSVKWGGDDSVQMLSEDSFQVRSYLPARNPGEVLASMSNETPYFFESRSELLRQLLRQNELSHGLSGLCSSKIDLIPHQIQIVARVLNDSIIRYLLADEVGLGKTVEAGIILRQLQLDSPGLKMAAFVPDQLVRQWREELDLRFDLFEVRVFGHSELPAKALSEEAWDITVIDEAHRVVANNGICENAFALAAGKISRDSHHLLLLSATPLLHHDKELLSLLELLDPENYSGNDLDAFRVRSQRRILLGRAFLALQNATAPALIKMNAKKLVEFLPDDSVVKSFYDELSTPDSDVKNIHRALHLHISETYRIHRRLLRTRRRWIAETDCHYIRGIDERAETEVDEESYQKLWQALDEWRTETAARVADSMEETDVCAEEYIRLAESIAAEPDRLGELVEEVIAKTNATESEKLLLDEIVAPREAAALTSARAELVCKILRERMRRDGDRGKYVIFCSSAEICRVLRRALKQQMAEALIRVVDQTLDSKDAGLVLSEFAHDSGRVLLTDSTGEEGFNLQFSRVVIFHDLPWSPMRIEQRLGRLDRIERSGRITCFDITSGEDESLCLDEVWRRVLVEGFGIFQQSISDLQHVIDAEIPHLRKVAFIGGPEALANEIDALRLRVSIERESIEEQDVIDGMYGLSSDSTLCHDLARTDEESEAFGDSLIAYFKKNVGLHLRNREVDNSVSFYIPRNASPIIPADQLYPLEEMLGKPSTFFRNVAAESFDLQFLRPGHVAIDACRELLEWDDRGRVFAMWREVPGIFHVKCIFRCVVHVRVDLTPVISKLSTTKFNALNRGSLLRLVCSWFPDCLSELFLGVDGEQVGDQLAEVCRRPYDNRQDINLGKERAKYIRNEIGDVTWQNWCVNNSEVALRIVSNSTEIVSKRDVAKAASSEHFALNRARIVARQRAGIDTAGQSKQALQHENELEDLVNEMLSNPIVSLDTIGAYLLSAEKFWEQQQ